MIDPNTNINGEEFEAYNIRRWGSSGWTRHLKQEGIKSGANFVNWTFWPNTLKAHRFVKYCQEKCYIDTNRSNEALFEALYEKGENISLVPALLSVGETLGVEDADDLRSYLESNDGEDDVKAEIEKGRRQYRISGVPFFVIGIEDESSEGWTQPPYGLSGAQSKSTFVEIFDELSNE